MSKQHNYIRQRIDYLEAEIQRVRKLYEKTLKYQDIDPEVSLFQARKSAEAICKSIFIKEGLHKKQGKPLNKLMLNDLIQLLGNNNLLPEYIKINLYTIQAFGNYGSHYQRDDNGVITGEYIRPCLLGLGTVFNWYVKQYHQSSNDDLLHEKAGDTVNSLDCVSKPCVGDGYHAGSESIKIVGNHAPPYRIFHEKGVSGVYFDVMKELACKIGFKIDYIKKPYKAALMMMKSGEADLMVGPNKTEERAKFMVFSNTTLPRERKGFFVHISGKPVLAYEDLYQRLLIVSRGKLYNDQIDYDPNLNKVTVTDYMQGFKLLQSDSVYVMIMPEKEGEYLIDQHELDVLTSPLYVEGHLSYLALSHKSEHRALFHEIDQALVVVKEGGLYEEIMHYY